MKPNRYSEFANYIVLADNSNLNPGSEHNIVSQYAHGTNNSVFSLCVGSNINGQVGIYAFIRDDAGLGGSFTTNNFNVLDNQWHETILLKLLGNVKGNVEDKLNISYTKFRQGLLLTFFGVIY